MPNAGRAELDLVAVGKDQVSAMLRQVDAQLRKTAGEMKGVKTQSESLWSDEEIADHKRWGASAEGSIIKPLKAVKENALFAIGAFTVPVVRE